MFPTEDPSKPRIRPKRHVHVESASSGVSSIRECTNEGEPPAIAPISDMPLQEHSHTTSVGRSESTNLEGRHPEISIHEMWRSSLHDGLGDGRISGGISLHDDFSLAQNDDHGLAEGLDDDLDSLFSGVPPDLEPSRTSVSDESLDGPVQNDTSQSTVTSDDFVITSPNDGFGRAGTRSPWTDVDAVDLTTRSNGPQLKLIGLPSSQRCFPSSRHKTRVGAVIHSRRPSARAERGASSAQLANVIQTPTGAGRRTTSPRPGGHVEHLSDRKRRYRSESELYSPDSRRVLVEAESNKTSSLSHQTLAEGSAAHFRRRENQFHKPDSKHGTVPIVGTPSSAHGPDSEQTLFSRGANLCCEDEPGPDLTLGEPSPTSAMPLDIEEPVNSHHEQEQHQGRLKSMSVRSVTPADAAFITAIIDSPADLQNVIHSPTAWALGCGVEPASLANISVQPLADLGWLLTATIPRRANGMNDLRRRRDGTGRRGRRSPDSNTSSDYCQSEGETGLRRTKRGQWTAEEDEDLRRWRHLGKSWSWIFDRFPERSEAAVRSRWFVVLAPRTRLDI
ncbi:hypothetical protein LTR10_024150 [Elasticomyces elasticus]|uniref:Myb-like domain-containing protein n=1 Tax=Exophiala sideris TaxID=1016849 RepID=A0ABR0IV02_9EURO|nr:hypothetical protein LTR10_024150 [Elasticomyces elasticus]KAK5020898.1 hypothetical protein LTS07_011363 [Exophiala sideris]KAK5023101.1 hypothetical protein LTR13_011332 [Exophiala sideris]KAK5048416.1 hypothetical protein LTR69_011378 [Exophiala sideris]KAK5176074.1 hypothetical protein LTR44_011379 [Eurotiomycetes sp. CCFEE 6388]